MVPPSRHFAIFGIPPSRYSVILIFFFFTITPPGI
jgi:hypothetical protein